ncbi:MAG: HEPN domain-containing protein [bacterium]
MRIEVQRLIKQAERDLENARKNISIEGYEVAAFLSEQAVEKYLKAYWMIAKKEAAPPTHSLTELGDALGVPRALRKQLVSLTADYITARYPDAANGVPYEIYDRETAEAKVASAEAVLAWLRKQIQD